MPRTPKPPDAIVTVALPRICPACGHPDLGRVETFGIYAVTCQACGWREKYRVKA